MKLRVSPLAATVFAMQALPALAQESTASVAGATRLSTVTVQDEAINDYKADEASSPKFTAPLLDTPKSVTVIPAQVLQDTGSTTLQEALSLVPGITFLAGEGGQALADRPVIRGLNSTSSLTIDGIRDIGTQTRDTFALETIEVTKGADSAYGGRGSGGGSVNLVTKQPFLKDATAATLTAGTSDTLRGTVDQNWKLGESSALRVNAEGAAGNVPGRDAAVDYDKRGAAASLGFGLGTRSEVVLDYYLMRQSGMPDYSMPYDPLTGLPVTETMGVDASNFYGLRNRDFRIANTDIGTLSFKRELASNMTLQNRTRYGSSLNSYVVTNPDDSKGNVDDGYVYRSSKSRWTETRTFANATDFTVQLQTGAISHSISAGAEFTRERKEQDSWLVSSSAGPATSGVCVLSDGSKDASLDCASLYNPNPDDVWLGTVKRANAPTYYTTQTRSLYAFDTLGFGSHWSLNAGLRWDDYSTEALRHAGTNSAGTAVSALYASGRDNFLNYQVGLVFKPVAAGSLYASYATDSTPAALGTGDEDAVTTTTADLKPEESHTGEVGVKWELFDRQTLLTFALFDTVRKNARIEVSSGVYEQVGESRIKGAELGITGNLTAQWNVFGGYSFLDSELVRGAYSSLAVGKSLPNTPEHSLTLSTRYQLLRKLSIGGTAYHVSEVYGSHATTATALDKRVPGYWRFDASTAYAFDERFDLQLNVQNLTDKVYYTKAYATHYAALGPGRLLLLSLNMKL
ncbi:MAG: TonB-dependent receptor [Steroidobacteraceae bacterium]